MRILHGPVNVGNQPWTLSRAERALGHKSDVVQNYGTWIGYPAERTLSEYARNTRRARFNRSVFSLTAPLRYDVIHYYFGRSFMLWDDFGMTYGASRDMDRKALSDVHLARRLGRTVVMTLQGCDARQARESHRINAVTMCRDQACPAFGACIDSLDTNRRAMIKTLLPLMDRVFYLNPEIGHMVPQGEFLPYANVDVMAETVNLPEPGRRPRILHAPSNAGIKGTSMILATLERLRSRFDFDLILVENTPHAEAMKLYRSADLAIDQILAGWYGGFAVELMAMGKPVAAFIREEDRSFVPPSMWNEMPVLRIDERTLENDLAVILADPQALVAAGERSRAYVERWHDPLKSARALTAIYRDPKAPLVLGC
ncbi:glycosyltransferase [Bosea sp. Leaf344]|uniref:glycosyltransferase n=1 Tax=Bosea sp. Leaf344 TaxID=1736346 RepID=UPI0012E353F0|nr:glycosyltransferase [Bosea sp. Leaf344]